ncbi:MAG: hypothetical protein ACRYG5_06670 [Janthinobacterium lividum]
MTTVIGIPGPQGKPGLNWRETWDPTATYEPGDGVTYNGAAWYCLSQSKNNIPGASPLQWTVVLQVSFPNYATFAALQVPPVSISVFVQADETKGGSPTLYFFDALGNRYWVAMVLDA